MKFLFRYEILTGYKFRSLILFKIQVGEFFRFRAVCDSDK